MPILNERIKKMRTQKGLTLLEVAEYLGVAEATAQRYESGNIKNIGHETICKLAELFNCNPAYLMGWVEEPSIVQATSVSQGEQRLVEVYRNLNNEGREKILQYAEDLFASGNYKKHGSLGVVSEA